MEVITYKCPNCGGDLTFDPASGKYKCEYCLSSFTQEEAEKAADSILSMELKGEPVRALLVERVQPDRLGRLQLHDRRDRAARGRRARARGRRVPARLQGRRADRLARPAMAVTLHLV